MKNEGLSASVALCTYNGTAFLRPQLESILSQTRPPDEIVLLDDASMDDTASLADEILGASGIPYRILRNDSNQGVKASFPRCILSCSGDIVFTADQDDIWREDKLSLMLAEYEKDTDCVLVFSDAELVDAEGKSLGSDVWSSLNLRRGGLKDRISREAYQRLLMYTWAVPGTVMSVRRSFAEKAFPIPEEGGYIHDSWLAITAPIYGKVVALDEKLTAYRQHGRNTVGVRAQELSRGRQDILQIRKILFYLKRHAARLRVVIKEKGEEIPPDYRKELTESIALFERYAHYEDDGALKKTLFLLARILDGGLKRFDISRGALLRYLTLQIFRKKDPA